MQPIIVHSAVGANAERIAHIYIDSWNQGFGSLMPTRVVTPELIVRWERDLTATLPQQWWVAEVDREVVGFVGIGPSRDPVDPNLGELDTIAVDPAWWRSGVGRALMTVALRGLADQGWRTAILWTLAHYERGQRFYTATGWQLDGAVRDEGRQVRYRFASG